MNRIFQTAAVGAALLLSAQVQAENLLEIYEKALRSDPALREAEANMMATQEGKPLARSSLLPQLGLSGSINNRVNDGVSTRQLVNPKISDQESDDDSYNWGISLNQTVFNTEQWRTLKRSNKESAQAEINFEAARQDLIIRVSESYFNVLAAQDTLVAEQATKQAIARQLEQAERRFEVGLIAITDVKESQAAYDDAIALEIQARRALATAKEGLREITGEYHDTLSAPGDNFPLIPPDPQIEQDWVDIALQQNLPLESAKIGAEISRQNIEIAKGGYFPTIDLSATYGKFRSDGEIDNQTNPALSGLTENNQSRKEIGVSMSFPIYQGGRTSSQVDQNVYRHRAARENYEKVARETEREARDAYLGVIAEIARVQALARSVESNQTALEATEAGYEVGTRTTVDVLNSRESLFRAQTQYARSKYDYLINVLKLKQAAGTLTADDIDDLNKWLEASEQLDVTPGRGGAPDAQMQETTVPSRPETSGSAQ